MSTLIIQSPHNQGTLRKYTQSSMTMMLWVLWVYLLLPVLAPLLILAGNDIQTINLTKESLNFIQFAAVLPLLMVMMMGYWLWSKYNTLLYCYRGEDILENVVYLHETPNYFGISGKDLASWQQLKQMTVNLTEQGDVSYVKGHKSLQGHFGEVLDIAG